jgi:hypothetical protein
MYSMEGLTASEMAAALGLPIKIVQQRLFRSGIKPLTKERLYPASALEAIRDASVGRPPRKPQEPGAPGDDAGKDAQ